MDLRTGALMPAQRGLHHQVSGVVFDATAECPAFMTFLHEITGGNQDLVDYLQRAVGYMLTGQTTEHCLFYLYGTGANGKSTFLNVCKGLLGSELCRQTAVETIMVRGQMSATPELAALKGARTVMTTEVDEGSF
ncbi:MAG: hypothetical protein IPQ15_09620 [Betaproteobacteria bacterium]|nr:hypothetical protein [Betaproteobacteria bacterium]